MKTIINFFKLLYAFFFGKSPKSKSITELRYEGVEKTPRVPGRTPAARRAYTHNNRRDTPARHVQNINMENGLVRAIYHSTYTS